MTRLVLPMQSAKLTPPRRPHYPAAAHRVLCLRPAWPNASAVNPGREVNASSFLQLQVNLSLNLFFKVLCSSLMNVPPSFLFLVSWDGHSSIFQDPRILKSLA